MQSDNTTPSPAEPGLPPVTPPSGTMILRLFLVPALIVVGLVGLFLVGPTLANWAGGRVGRSWGESRSADQFLRDLDDTNPEVRWRAASDLAQVLLRNDQLASDVGFGFALTDRLEQARTNSAPAEKAFAERQAGLNERDKARELKKLDADRTYVMFLTASVGNLIVPVGVEQLTAMAKQEDGLEPGALVERRRRALWALATLGENLKRFDTQLSDEQRDEVMQKLEAASETGQQRKLARQALDHLAKRRKGEADTLGVGAVLAHCAGDDDPSVRYHAAFAMTFWVGRGPDEDVMVKALIRLTRDDGRGEDKLLERLESNPDSKVTRSLVKKRGFRVQPQAAIALARRGSPSTPLDLLAEMFSPERLREIFVLHNKKTNDEVPDEAIVVLIVTDTLKALVKLREQRPEDTRLNKRFGPILDELAQSPNARISTEARTAQTAFGRGE